MTHEHTHILQGLESSDSLKVIETLEELRVSGKVADIPVLIEILHLTRNPEIKSKIIESKAQCGGGSLPQLEFNSYAVELDFEGSNKKFVDGLYKKLLRSSTPVLSILREGNIVFDVLTIQHNEINIIAGTIGNCFNELHVEK